jgi:manganese transport protein
MADQSSLSVWKRVALFLSTVSPGIFLIGYNIGTGSVTTMASAGADYGMLMVWPLLLSCIFTYILIFTFGRFTAVTGDTALYAFRKYFGGPVTLFVLASLLFSEWVSSMGVMAVVSQVVQEWSRPLTPDGDGFSPVLLAGIFCVVLYAIFWRGKHKFFESVLTIFVSIMGLSFLLSMFMVIPDPMEIIKGLVPGLPHDSDAALLMAGMVGTTMGAILFVVRSILVQEKGWTVKDLHLEKRDAFVSALVMFLLSVAIMASAAGTLHPRGLHIENAIDMVRLLEPLAGRFAISIFVAGIVSAGLSSLFPIVLLAPWLFADYQHRQRDLQSTSTRLLVLFGVSLGLVVPVFGGRPVLIMIASQALCAIVSPLVVLLMMILQNKKDLLGEYRASTGLNIWLIIILVFTVVIAVLGVVGVIGLIEKGL